VSHAAAVHDARLERDTRLLAVDGGKFDAAVVRN
jgi:hypothetical protein